MKIINIMIYKGALYENPVQPIEKVTSESLQTKFVKKCNQWDDLMDPKNKKYDSNVPDNSEHAVTILPEYSETLQAKLEEVITMSTISKQLKISNLCKGCSTLNYLFYNSFEWNNLTFSFCIIMNF